MDRRRGSRIVFGSVVVVFFGLGVGALVASRSEAPLGPPRPLATIEKAAGATGQKTPSGDTFVGVVLAPGAVDVASPVAGRLLTVTARVGDRVKKGAALASVEGAKQELAAGEAGARAEEAEAAKARIELAEARERLGRLEKLGKQFTSAEDLANARFAVRRAQNHVRETQARVAQNRAKLAQLRQTLADGQIRAPFDGTVSARFLDPGAMTGPSVPIVRMITDDAMRVRFAIPDDKLGVVAAGSPIRTYVESLDTHFEGVVEQVSPEVDSAARMIFVEGSIAVGPEWQGKLPSGLLVRVSPGEGGVATLGEGPPK